MIPPTDVPLDDAIWSAGVLFAACLLAMGMWEAAWCVSAHLRKGPRPDLDVADAVRRAGR